MRTQPSATSPAGGAPVTGEEPLYAWLGRVSTKDMQDPTISLPDQLRRGEEFVARHGGRIIAWYWDIESGSKRLADRKGGTAGFDIPIPRDGGLLDLLDHARSRPLWNRVICENVNRIARRSSVTFTIEDDLRDLGIRLCGADEPLDESFGSIVLRHVNVGLAKGYAHELQVKSRGRQEVSVQQGWHTGGIALYGYRFIEHKHPNPNKASRGLKKRTLELHPLRAPVVRAIFNWYLSDGLGLKEIRDRLNDDPDRYPPPACADPARALGKWSTSTLWEMLRNPKYTGYQVWNRKATKKGGKPIPPELWVWSEEPAHPPIVTREELSRVRQRAAANEASRRRDPAAPQPPAEYLYRSFIRCGLDGLRMWGNRRRSSIYYTCQPGRARAAIIPNGHPANVYLNEADLHGPLLDFLATNVYGADRADYWRHALAKTGDDDLALRAADRAAELRSEIIDLQRRLHRQVVSLEDDDTPAARKHIGARIADLEVAITDRQQRLDALLTEQPVRPDPDSVVAALARLPLIGRKLHKLPHAELRGLLDSLQLTVTYDPNAHAADVTITLPADAEKTHAVAQVCSVPPEGFEPALGGF